MCVFCYDGLVCPIQKRILLKAAAVGSSSIAAKPVIVGAPAVENTIALAGVLLQRRRIIGTTASAESEEDTMEKAIRICSEPGCDKKLAHNNAIGKCRAHGGGSHRAMPAEHGTCTLPGCGAKLAHNNTTGKCRIHAGDEGNAQRAHSRGSAPAHSNGRDLAIEARLELVMSKIPLAEKLAFVNRWISGEC